jgi:restriction system protein
MAKKSKSEFVQWMPYILDALRELGGSATPKEVYDAVARLAKVPDEKRFAKMSGGSDRFPNQVAWARLQLVKEGLLSSPKRGIWMLTPAGKKKHLTYEESHQIFLRWVRIFAERRSQVLDSPQATPGETPGELTPASYKEEMLSQLQKSSQSEGIIEAPTGYKEEMLSQLLALTPAAFERFCADLLKHLGLERVKVTGGTGDKGIDGEGYLPIGPIVTAKIAFQCKRHSGAVSSKDVQSFQGAIGAAEKGIFFTTGYFTDSAREAARSPGCKPIELIDGDRLVDLCESNEFGLKPAKTYEVDYAFTSNYEKEAKGPKGGNT